VDALRRVIREPLFVARVPEPDYGVDFLAEVVTDDSEATNWHLAIQLRSQDPAQFVEQGAYVSVGFKTRALNYLFRGVGLSIIVAYDVPRDRLYWQWTHEAIVALDAGNREWRDQETVSVRVPTQNALTVEAADVIRREVLEYHQRALASTEALLAPVESRAAAERLASERDVVAAIRDGGVALVSAGLHSEVLSGLRGVPEADWIRDHVVVLAVAHAYERCGSPLQALYYANRIPSDVPQFDDDHWALVSCIRSSARLALGQIEAEDHWEELREVGERFPQSFVAAQATLIALSADAVLASKHRAERERVALSVLERARAVFAVHTEKMKRSREAKWALWVLLAQVESEVGDQLMIWSSTRIRIAEDMRLPISLTERVEMARQTIDLMDIASKRLQAVTTEAREAGETHWASVAYLAFLESQIKRFGLFAVVDVPDEDQDQAAREDLLRQTAAGAGETAAQFARAGELGLAFRARRLQGEAYAMLGEESELVDVQQDLERQASQLGLHREAARIVGPFERREGGLDERGMARMWVDEVQR